MSVVLKCRVVTMSTCDHLSQVWCVDLNYEWAPKSESSFSGGWKPKEVKVKKKKQNLDWVESLSQSCYDPSDSIEKGNYCNIYTINKIIFIVYIYMFNCWTHGGQFNRTVGDKVSDKECVTLVLLLLNIYFFVHYICRKCPEVLPAHMCVLEQVMLFIWGTVCKLIMHWGEFDALDNFHIIATFHMISPLLGGLPEALLSVICQKY